MRRVKAFACVSLTLLAGCGGLPAAGPRSSEIIERARSAEARRLGIVLVDVSPGVIAQLRQRRPASLRDAFGEGAPFVPVIGPGDVLSITIWEAGAGSLFSAPVIPGQPLPPSRGAALPNMVVQADGMITIPYAGRVPVTGLQPAAVEQAIIARNDRFHRGAVNLYERHPRLRRQRPDGPRNLQEGCHRRAGV
jgi:polysaccharide export outer membrane protein